MSLAEEYRRQAAWRDWPRIFEALPPLRGLTVLDLGCKSFSPQLCRRVDMLEQLLELRIDWRTRRANLIATSSESGCAGAVADEIVTLRSKHS